MWVTRWIGNPLGLISMCMSMLGLVCTIPNLGNVTKGSCELGHAILHEQRPYFNWTLAAMECGGMWCIPTMRVLTSAHCICANTWF